MSRPTSTQEVNVFGTTIGDGQCLMINEDAAKACSTSFAELYKAFQKVAPADAKAWLLQNGAVVVPDGGPITETIVVDAEAVRRQAKSGSSG